MKFTFIIGSLLILSSAGQAQTAPGGQEGIAPAAQQAQEVAAARVAFNSAVALAKAGSVTQVEAVLTPLNRTKPNTAAWHMETGMRLLQVADALARAGQPAHVLALANSALQHMVQAPLLTSNPHDRAAAKTLEGTIYERYLGDSKTALASYRAAAELSPATATKARESVERLQRLTENVAARERSR